MAIKIKSGFLGVADSYWLTISQILLGSLFLSLMAQIAIPLPFTPVPITMQTLGVSILAISLGAHKASLSVLTYLIQATMGLPVLAKGVSNPLWIADPKAGYLIGFLISSFLVGKLFELQKKKTFLKSWLILSLNEWIVLFLGASFLGIYVGGENAIVLGVLPFIPGAFLKITMAAASVRSIEWTKNKFL